MGQRYDLHFVIAKKVELNALTFKFEHFHIMNLPIVYMKP